MAHENTTTAGAATGATAQPPGQPQSDTATAHNAQVPIVAGIAILAIARLATGTPGGTKFVRDDGVLTRVVG